MLLIAVAYFVSYLLFSLTTKLLGQGHGADPPIPGLLLLPATTLACCMVWGVFLAAQAAYSRCRKRPSYFTYIRTTWAHPDVLLASAASAAILLASSLAYSRPEVSLLLPMLLMKSGPNLWAPLVDWLRGSGISTRARVVFGLACVATIAALWSKISLAATFAVTVTVGYAFVYMLAYFPKQYVLAKYRSDVGFLMADLTTTLIIALPASFAIAVGYALQQGIGVADMLSTTWTLLHRPLVWVASTASEGAGLFGGLVFIAPMASTMSVPLNRCISLLGGFTATLVLWGMRHGTVLSYFRGDSVYELVGVAAMLTALAIGLPKGGGGGGVVVGREATATA